MIFGIHEHKKYSKIPADCVAMQKCPHPDCKAMIYIQPSDDPGEYQCGCHACNFVLAEDHTVELKKK